MKIGIVTFHRALNYGALLQAFALKQTLNNLGAEAQLIDYRNPIIEEMYYYPCFFERKSPKERIKYLIQGKKELERRKKFDCFRKKYLNLTESIFYSDNIKSTNEMYDRFIVGSDQVWNYGAHNFDENFLLYFVHDKKKKYSYAASFGVSKIPEEYAVKYNDLLNDFTMCSVREMQGLEILKQLGIDRRRLDIDPTMLLTKKDWSLNFNISVPPIKNKYIFTYYFELTDSLRNYIESIARQTGYTVVYLGNPLKSPFNCKSFALKTADPEDFIRSIANAELVITNSFHGTALSIIFNKNFYVEMLKKDSKVNGRIENILDLFNLNNRILRDNISDEKIKWVKINQKMAELRVQSLNYLKEIINE